LWHTRRSLNGADVADALERKLGLGPASAVVVASMIGSGIFTTTGLLAGSVSSPGALLAMWAIGGVWALCGALCYAELVAALPRNGGEYHLLSRVYHPSIGFLAAWISLIVGFSAPIAATSIAFGKYVTAVSPGLSGSWLAAGLIVSITAVHCLDVALAGRIHTGLAGLKVLIVAAFVLGGLSGFDGSLLTAQATDGAGLFSAAMTPAFAVGLIYVSFSYAGWNGAAYIAGEVKEPSRTLPLALLAGTGVVMVLYLAVNVVFLSSVPIAELSGVVEVGHLVAVELFGERAGPLLSIGIAIALVSSVSAMVMTGPRVYQAAAEDHPRLGSLAWRSSRGAPVVACLVQGGVALAMALTSTFESLLVYVGVTLSLSSGLTVAGVLVLRMREPQLERPYRAWGYPVTPLLFLVLTTWVVVHTFTERPTSALVAGLTLAVAVPIYLLVRGSRSASSSG